jgi:glycogen(starch) synthase
VRILVLTNQYPPHSVGGYALSCQSIVEYFRHRGHNVYVLTSDARLPSVEDDPKEVAPGVHRDLYFWFRELGREPKIPRFPLRERWKHERRNQQTLWNALTVWRPDVVSVWEMGAMSLTMLTLVERAGIPIVLTLHDYWPQYALQWDPWLRVFEQRPWIRQLASPLRMETGAPDLSNATVNVISHSLRDKLSVDARWRFPQAEVIPFGIDPRLFPVVEPEPRPWNWRLLYVGRLELLKGLRTLALAMRRLPPSASLEVIGSGDPAISALVKQTIGEPAASERLRFSSCPRPELAERYREADVLVFPSEWDEPFGLVPLEAMASGVPVVATGTGGSGEYLRDGENCLLFPPGDSDRLAAAIQRLAGEPHIRRKIVLEGSSTADRYSLDRVAKELEDLHLAAAGVTSKSA